jgi:hypothetical protein
VDTVYLVLEAGPCLPKHGVPIGAGPGLGLTLRIERTIIVVDLYSPSTTILLIVCVPIIESKADSTWVIASYTNGSVLVGFAWVVTRNPGNCSY